jgi:hypothetical protein
MSNPYVEANKAKQVALLGHNGAEVNVDANGNIGVINFGQLVPDTYDEIDLTYVTSGNGTGEIETVTYKEDSSIIAVLTLSYDSNNNLINVVRS